MSLDLLKLDKVLFYYDENILSKFCNAIFELATKYRDVYKLLKSLDLLEKEGCSCGFK